MSVDPEALKRAEHLLIAATDEESPCAELCADEALAVIAALERAELLRAVAEKLVQRGPQSAVWPEFYDLVTSRPGAWKQAAGRAAAPEGGDGCCQCSDMPPHDSGFCPQCGKPEARRG